jgi:hypothetical protein
MSSIQDQLLLAEIKVKLMELLVNLQDDVKFTKQDAIEELAGILDSVNQTSVSFRQMIAEVVK